MNRRWIVFAGAATVIYAVLVFFSWSALTQRARRQTESMLDYAMLDLDATLNGSIDTMLMHAADSITEQLGHPKPLSPEAITLIAKQRDLDEVNVIARDGTFLASTDARLVGLTMADRPQSAEFLILTNGSRHAFSHHFRPGAHNTDVRRKYVGVSFPGGNGFVQVGMDETRVTGMFPSIMGFIFDEWLLGETGFFLCADLSDGHLISNPARHRDEARFLSETGYDPSAPQVFEDGKTTFRQRIFGEVSDCRSVIFCGHRILAALPPTEFYSTRTFYVFLIAAVLGFVMVAFVLLMRRIDMDSCRLESFYATEEDRRAKELAIASTIQNAALPGPLPPSDAFSLSAAMQPAREIGGDFYDYFHLDPTHVAFLVADVSGKGITAALYMMTAKTLIKDKLLSVRDPAEALTRANAELCANNPANMFLTVWVGILDLETGVVTYANAGHNPPVRVESPKSKVESPGARGESSKSKVERLGADEERPTAKVEFITPKSGPILAFMDGVGYTSYSLRLAPGDTLFLYTDGVTEALDTVGVLFGEDRLRDALSVAGGSDPASFCRIVRTAIAAFSEGTMQADDITVLAIRRNGGADDGAERRVTRAFPPTQDGIAAASEFLDEALNRIEGQGVGGEGPVPGVLLLAPKLHVILDELASNVVKHSGASGFELGVGVLSGDGGVPEAAMVLSDDGTPFDPLGHADPDTTLSAAERPIGGLGIMMVRKMADAFSYERRGNRNVLTIRCRLKSA